MNCNPPNGHHRDRDLDFLKGFLVLAMLLYHMVSALKISVSWYNPLLHHVPGLLNFVSGSWVFVSGVIVARYYQPKFALAPLANTQRLWIRGIKLLLIFLILNYLIYRLGLKPGVKFNLDTLIQIFMQGGGYLSSFEILIGIAYVLIIAPLILVLRGFGTALLLIISTIVFVRSALGISIEPNLWIIVMGLLGILSMQLATKALAYENLKSVYLGRAFLFSLLGITIVLFIIYSNYNYNKNIVSAYFMNIVCINTFVYLAYRHIKISNFIDRTMRKLGRHSLVGYFGQMLIIWISIELYKLFDLNNNIVIWMYLFSSVFIFLLFMFVYDLAHKRVASVKYIDDLFFR